MQRVSGGDNEYKVASGETVRADFEPSAEGNVRIRVQENDGPFHDVVNNSYSFVGNGDRRTLVFEFIFAVPGECSIDISGSSGGDTYHDEAVFLIDRPDQRDFVFHP